MKKALKAAVKILLITIVIFVVAIAAAPLFVRQEQIKSFVENKVVLSEGSKLTIDGDIGFGIFPYSFVKLPKAIITDKNGIKTSIDNIKFGFNPSSLFKKSVVFDIAFKSEPTDYSGHVEFKDYHGFINNWESPIVISLEKPANIEAKADFKREGDKITLKNIRATYKQTEFTADFESIFSGNLQKINIKGTINTQNLDDLRKLYKLADNNDFNLLSGSGKIDFNLATSGVKAQDFLADLNGSGTIGLNDAYIYGLDLNQIIGTPEVVHIEKNYEKKIEISKLDGTFTITKAVLVTRDLKLSNQFATASAKGQADLVRHLLAANVDVDADLAAAQINVPLLVSGTFEDIKVAPRTADAVRNNVAGALGKINLKNVKLDKNSIQESLKRIKSIGKGIGIDVNSIINKNVEPEKVDNTLDQNPAPKPVVIEGQ